MRVVFPSGRQRVFLEAVQQATQLDPEELAEQLQVCPRTVRDWRRARWNMSESALEQLCRISGLARPNDVSILPEHWSVHKAARRGGLRRAALHGPLGTLESRRRGGLVTAALIREHPNWARQRGITVRKTIRVPAHSEELAEFIGIFLGDGGFRNAWQVAISFNIHGDRPYARFIRTLVQQLFGLQPTWCVRPSLGAGDLLISSTSLVEFLEGMGWRSQRKSSSSISIPAWVESTMAYRVACLRGMMDTDGSVYPHRYRVNGKWYTYPKLSLMLIRLTPKTATACR